MKYLVVYRNPYYGWLEELSRSIWLYFDSRNYCNELWSMISDHGRAHDHEQTIWDDKKINNDNKYQAQLQHFLMSHYFYSIDVFILDRWLDWNGSYNI